MNSLAIRYAALLDELEACADRPATFGPVLAVLRHVYTWMRDKGGLDLWEIDWLERASYYLALHRNASRDRQEDGAWLGSAIVALDRALVPAWERGWTGKPAGTAADLARSIAYLG